MPTHRRQYPAWKAPSEDGAILVWPSPAELIGDMFRNLKHLASQSDICVQNVPLAEVRSAMRRFIGCDDYRPPIIAMGHQTELIHPGVWAKNCLINAVASRLNGQAFHLAVDTDAPKHLTLRLEGESFPITDDPAIATAAWSGQLASPSPAHLKQIHVHADDSLLPHVLDSLRRLSMNPDQTLSSALANALHELDWSLGLRHHTLLTSPIWHSPSFLLYAHDLLARADSVAAHYNTALATYRADHSIRSTTRPMPNLLISPGAVEIPFWLDDLGTGQRSRPSVFRDDQGWILKLLNGEEFVFGPETDGWESASRLQKWLAATNHRLSPRALTLTMFFRVFLVDQFVHGIGGGQYDQVTDELIARHYGIEPPKFAVTTATMYLPQAVGRQRVCVPCVKQEGHRLRHGLLGERKLELVGQIESLPRRSPQRLERFIVMHKALATAAAETGVMSQWSARLRETREREMQEQSLFDREQFYAMQTRERLIEMIGRFGSEFQ
jgi:hypothetical protein